MGQEFDPKPRLPSVVWLAPLSVFGLVAAWTFVFVLGGPHAPSASSAFASKTFCFGLCSILYSIYASYVAARDTHRPEFYAITVLAAAALVGLVFDVVNAIRFTPGHWC